MRIPQTFIDEVIARADLVEIIGARVQLKKSGREYKACCPFHAEKTPSFWVSPQKQFYHCFGCGAHGTAIGFLMSHDKLGFVEAVEDLAHRAGLEVPAEARTSAASTGALDLHEILAEASVFYQQNLRDDERARDYSKARGIEAVTAGRFALGYAPASWDALLRRLGTDDGGRRRLLLTGLAIEREARGEERAPAPTSRRSDERGMYDRFRDRLMFPIRDARGRTLGFGGRILDQGEPKYLNSPETALFHKGRELYGLYEARQARADFKRVLLVEGYMDVVRLHQAGITNAVATLGTATTPDQLQKIFRSTNKVVFCFDGDRAGRHAAWRALENSLPLARDGREFGFLFLPEGQDPDSLMAREDARAFEARIDAALPCSEYLVHTLMESVDMSHADGRASLSALAKPLLASMPEGVLRELITDRLAAEVRMPAGKFRELLFKGSRVTALKPAARLRKPVRAGRSTLLTQAIGLALHFPRAAAAAAHFEQLESVDLPGIDVLRELLTEARSASLSTASLLERWRGRAEFGRLSELAGESSLVHDNEAAVRELNMAIAKLAAAAGPGRRTDELLQKARDSGLNLQEKAELNQLLKERGRPADTSLTGSRH